jgi:hypothetical protein
MHKPETRPQRSLARPFPRGAASRTSCRPSIRIISALSSLLILLGCMTMSVTQLPPQRANMFSASVEQEGLFVAARVVRDPDELQNIFNYDLPSNGILPVLVYFENRSETVHFLIDKDAIALYDGKVTAADAELDLSGKTNTGTAATIAGAALLSLPLVFVGLKVASDAEVIPHNMHDKELRSTTLASEGTTYGFLYYPITEPVSDNIVLEAKVALPHQEKPLLLNLPISVRTNG